ncbi:MAG: class I SAM-dependent methyltransferase [Actinomycetota bacterium]|nr:class I SAM-dependent methyltransferase [Actinomycetota bacterium]
MDAYGDATYGDRIAEIYDDMYEDLFDKDEVVGVLAGLAGSGPALELAIGTGRIALPLAGRGVEVHGIDASEAMVAKLRAKPGGDALAVTMGDFADVAVEASYTLVYVVFNTFFALQTQEDQVRCFANVARRLTPGGSFLVEAYFPDVARFDRGQRVHANRVRIDRISLETSVHDPVEQTVLSQQVVISQEKTMLYPVSLRYAWPSEMDLMARLAGLGLRSRWGGWKGEKVTAQSQKVVSIYEKPIDA